MNDWLWDGTPPEDPEEARIAAALAGLGKERVCPALPERSAATGALALPERPAAREPSLGELERPASPTPAQVLAHRTPSGNVPLLPKPSPAHRSWAVARWAVPLALAAVALLAYAWPRDRWELRVLGGQSPCGEAVCGLAANQSVTTDLTSSFEIIVGEIGTARLGPNSRLARLDTEEGHLLRLEAGRLDVAVTALPRDFRVETPAAVVVDLGCAYGLSVDAHGTHLVVEDGSVSLENDAGISIVTAGSQAVAKLSERPTLPVRIDASPALVAAVEDLEASLATGTAPDPAFADAILATARAEDLLTLWHVIQLVPSEPRARILDGVLARAPGVKVDRPRILQLEGAALTTLWQDLVPVALAAPKE